MIYIHLSITFATTCFGHQLYRSEER